MRPDPRVLLADIDLAGADISRFTEGMTGDACAGDALTQAAVEREFELPNWGRSANELRDRRSVRSPAPAYAPHNQEQAPDSA